MELRVVKPPGQDLMVERLKSRYGVGGGCPSEPGRRRPDVAERRRRPPRTPEDFGFYSRGDEAGPSLRCYSDERRRGPASPRGALKRGTVSWQDDELDSFQDLKQRETEEEFAGNDHRVSTSEINKQSFKEINKAVAGPTNSASDSRNWTDCCSDASDSPSKRVSSPASRASNRQGVLPRQVSQIYDELLQIYQKLQCETAAQQEFAEELQKRERFLAEREELLFRHESALNKIKGVREEVLTRFQILKEQHDAEVEHLTEVLKERNKESRRLRSSFDALKELNDSLKKQLLPVMTEQLQWMPFVNAKLHEPFVKFIYWSLRQLDAGTQHSTMTSTLRRLGEDIFKGVVTKGLQDNSFEHSVESKPKTAAFFKSSSLPLRFLSTLIVLKTVTQADHLAQAFDSLCLDLKADEGKNLFLECQAVPVVLSHLKVSSKGLLSSAIDSLLQMTVESRFLQPFLEVCSCSLFFRTCSVLLRGPKLDLHILEKLSIILQKLSKIKSNKKLFELFTVHLMLQEIQRTTHPEHAFLCINLNSTLFNLGLTKCNSLAASANP
ncbi:coiled-coil domain-containing protein 138 isoform X14 [Balaenoptera musculus]|uniref:Coiled-coil domain-containing protein 138 isoform X14 n=1 Tax=Balaenoptera musculus TaxID=9771 RepID=A0A8B8Z900_BALMU|nr:coiled-coil domain-containing protein 138 isoform X14 [Balaenoptera musculus]